MLYLTHIDQKLKLNIINLVLLPAEENCSSTNVETYIAEGFQIKVTGNNFIFIINSTHQDV